MGNVEILHKSYLIFTFFHALKSKITKTFTVVFTVRCKENGTIFLLKYLRRKAWPSFAVVLIMTAGWSYILNKWKSPN